MCENEIVTAGRQAVRQADKQTRVARNYGGRGGGEREKREFFLFIFKIMTKQLMNRIKKIDTEMILEEFKG